MPIAEIPATFSGHKFGLAPLGCGWVIWRDEEALPQELVFNVDYLGGQIGTFAINFSRPATGLQLDNADATRQLLQTVE